MPVLLAAIVLASTWDATLTPARQKALNDINPGDLRKTVSFLASDKLEGRGTPSKGLDMAADYIADEFKKDGLQPAGDDGTFFQVTEFTPRNGAPGKVRNVIGILKGSDPTLADQYVMVTAHYDHLGTRGTGEGDHIYNGANDDGSGTAGVVALAHALGKAKPKRSVIFMTFWGEERGLLGSSYYGKHPVVPLAKTVADINLEQIGRTDDLEGPRVNAVSVTGYDFSDTVRAMEAAGKVLGTGVQHHPQYSDAFFMRSDNAAMAAAGVPAHTICVAFEYPDYHGLADTADKLDYDNMTKVVKLAGLTILTIADAPEAPKWNGDNPNTAPYRKVRGEG